MPPQATETKESGGETLDKGSQSAEGSGAEEMAARAQAQAAKLRDRHKPRTAPTGRETTAESSTDETTPQSKDSPPASSELADEDVFSLLEEGDDTASDDDEAGASELSEQAESVLTQLRDIYGLSEDASVEEFVKRASETAKADEDIERMRKDYTQKTQSISEQRKAFEAEHADALALFEMFQEEPQSILDMAIRVSGGEASIDEVLEALGPPKGSETNVKAEAEKSDEGKTFDAETAAQLLEDTLGVSVEELQLAAKRQRQEALDAAIKAETDKINPAWTQEQRDFLVKEALSRGYDEVHMLPDVWKILKLEALEKRQSAQKAAGASPSKGGLTAAGETVGVSDDDYFGKRAKEGGLSAIRAQAIVDARQKMALRK